MKRQKLYILYSHFWHSTAVIIRYATTDFERIKVSFKNLWNHFDEAGYKVPTPFLPTPDSLKIIDFGMDNECERFVIQTFDTEIPEDKFLFGIFEIPRDSNGEGEMLEICISKDQAIKRVLMEICDDNTTKVERANYIFELENATTLCTDSFDLWNIIKFKVSD